MIFIVFYSIGIQTPQRGLGPEDVVIYVMAVGYVAEEVVRVRKIGLVSLNWSRRMMSAWQLTQRRRQVPALTYWTCINLIIYSLMGVALV